MINDFERPIVTLNVKQILPKYENASNNGFVTKKWKYNVVHAHFPGDFDSQYTIVDSKHLANNVGINELCIRPLSDSELKNLKEEIITSRWYKPNIQVYSTQYPIDVTAYFQCYDWQRQLEKWCTEGLKKDSRLVDCFKSIVIPLFGDSTLFQPLNAHCIWIIITNVGKSYYAYLLGDEPIIEPTVAGAIGSYDSTYKETVINKGYLNGEGFPLILDEGDTYDKPLVQKLLTYIETGKVKRGLKHPITIEGTKTIVLNSNPSTSDMISSVARFITNVCTADHPKRIGKRFGFLLLGDDYLEVEDEGADSSVRDEVRRVIETVVHQYRSNIHQMIKDNMDWIKEREPDIKREILGYASKIPNKIVSEFVEGQGISCMRKLKTSAIRYLLLEQLNRVPDNNVDFSSKEDVFDRLLDINRDSWRKLSVMDIPEDKSAKKMYVRKLKAEHPDMSYRSIGNLVDVSHTTVKNWLEE